MKSVFTPEGMRRKVHGALAVCLSAALAAGMLPGGGFASYAAALCASEEKTGICTRDEGQAAECSCAEPGESGCIKMKMDCPMEEQRGALPDAGDSVEGDAAEDVESRNEDIVTVDGAAEGAEGDGAAEGTAAAGVPAYFSEAFGADRGTAASGDLDFSSQNTDSGSLDTDGYHWDANARKLTLKDAAINGTVTFPDEAVTIDTTGDCSIAALAIAGGTPQKTQLTFSGTGKLTVEGQINISGGDGNILTVMGGVHVVANGGICIGASGGVNSVVTVNGTLTLAGNNGSAALSAGKVVVGSGGLLKVSGNEGVLLNGIRNGSGAGLDFTGVFTVQEGGCFAADCTVYNLKAVLSGTGFTVENHADKAVSLPREEDYLPIDCKVKVGASEVNLVKKETEAVYTGPMTIHENHQWPAAWNRKDTVCHWKECEFEWCSRTKDSGTHSFDAAGKCACGAVLEVALTDGDRRVYNGQEQKPDVAVKVDGVELEASNWNAEYRNNIRAGQASVTVGGKGGLTFERTMTFRIARATPEVEWADTAQTVTYSGEPAAVTPPAVTLVNGEIYGGEIIYSHAADGTGSYAAGLPVDAGRYTVRAGIVEQDDYEAAGGKNTLALTIGKAPAPAIGKETRKYACTTGSNGAVTIDVAGRLPANRGKTIYKLAAISDDKNILSNVSVDSGGSLVYTVLGNKAEEDRASVTVAAEMANYEDATFTVEIELVLKSIVELQAGSSVSVKGGGILTYGQQLSDLPLDSAVFVKQGTDTEVKGTLAWKNGSHVPVVGTTEAEWVFTPENSDEYVELTGMAGITVVKAAPEAEAPGTDAVTYHPAGILDSVGLNGGKATWTVGGRKVTVGGSWRWKDPRTVPTVENSGYTAVFTPDDTVNYDTVEKTVAVGVAKAAPYIAARPGAAQITYGDALSMSALTGGMAQYGESDKTGVEGIFAWKDGSLKPAVADSGATGYTVVFIPADGTNYSRVETEVTLTVEQAENAPNRPSGTMDVAWECKKAGSAELPQNWEWQAEDADAVLEVGIPLTATAVYVGKDKENYKNVTAAVVITRAECVHNWNVTSEEAATTTVEGKRIYTCSKCGETWEEAIPKLPEDTGQGGSTETGSGEEAPAESQGAGAWVRSPMTGQPQNPWPALAVGVLAAFMCVGGFLAVKRKKADEN